MRRALPLLVLLGVVLGACQVTIPNIFGGAPLVLTGNYTNDRAGIDAFAASIKAGIAADATTVQGWFNELCPDVAQAQQTLADPTAQATIQQGASNIGLTASATKVQINNINQGLSLGAKFCSVGTATNLQAAFLAALDAVHAVENLIKSGST